MDYRLLLLFIFSATASRESLLVYATSATYCGLVRQAEEEVFVPGLWSIILYILSILVSPCVCVKSLVYKMLLLSLLENEAASVVTLMLFVMWRRMARVEDNDNGNKADDNDDDDDDVAAEFETCAWTV